MGFLQTAWVMLVSSMHRHRFDLQAANLGRNESVHQNQLWNNMFWFLVMLYFDCLDADFFFFFKDIYKMI